VTAEGKPKSTFPNAYWQLPARDCDPFRFRVWSYSAFKLESV